MMGPQRDDDPNKIHFILHDLKLLLDKYVYIDPRGSINIHSRISHKVLKSALAGLLEKAIHQLNIISSDEKIAQTVIEFLDNNSKYEEAIRTFGSTSYKRLLKKLSEKADEISSNYSQLSIYIDQGTAPNSLIAEILSDLSILYKLEKGSGITYSPSEIYELEHHEQDS